jgi:hypothetical protein
MRLGLKRQPEKSAFGSDCHPAALLDQVRANAASAEWWRSQLAALTATDAELEATRERTLAEWSMALWCAAAPKVVVELFADWHRVMLDLPDPRRRPVVDAALRCSTHGWVPKLSSHLPSEDPTITALLGFRNQPVQETATTSTAPRTIRLKYRPLIEVARDRRWFKVDDAGAYR